jgi:ribonuclease HI
MITLHFDGACGPYNPGGHMGCGVVFRNGYDEIIHTISQQYTPKDFNNNTSNNLAEYIALILGLQWCIDNNHTEVNVFGDSQLVINQMIGKFRIKNGIYVDKAHEAKELISKFNIITFTHIKRELNDEADELSKIVIDGYNSQTDPLIFKKKVKTKSDTHQQPKKQKKVKVKINPLSPKDALDPIKVVEWQEKYKKLMSEIKPVRKKIK